MGTLAWKKNSPGEVMHHWRKRVYDLLPKEELSEKKNYSYALLSLPERSEALRDAIFFHKKLERESKWALLLRLRRSPYWQVKGLKSSQRMLSASLRKWKTRVLVFVKVLLEQELFLYNDWCSQVFSCRVLFNPSINVGASCLKTKSESLTSSSLLREGLLLNWVLGDPRNYWGALSEGHADSLSAFLCVIDNGK